MLYSSNYTSPLGNITIASDGHKLSGLWIEGQKYFASSIKGEMFRNDNLQIFADTKKWLDKYFAKQKPNIKELPLAPEGNDFRQAVWDILISIPYGEVTTYGEIAKIIAARFDKSSMSAQAVGGAVGHNPISIIIPCHRVVGKNGSLTGYAGGINLKVKLLELEGVDTSQMFIPKIKV